MLRSGREGLGVGVANTLVDSANTDTSSHADVDVASVSPAGTPRVTDDVVVRRSRGNVADDDDSVVGGSTTATSSVSGNNSRLIRLEGLRAGVDTDSIGLDLDSRHHVSGAGPVS